MNRHLVTNQNPEQSRRVKVNKPLLWGLDDDEDDDGYYDHEVGLKALSIKPSLGL